MWKIIYTPIHNFYLVFLGNHMNFYLFINAQTKVIFNTDKDNTVFYKLSMENGNLMKIRTVTFSY